MNEMLANHHFLVRNYSGASEELERIINVRPDKKLMKKLIICYTQTGRPDEALNLFLSVIKDDINIITSTNLDSEDCPCPELIFKVESNDVDYKDKYTKSYVLGILWLYCDLAESLKYFLRAKNFNQENDQVDKIIILLKKTISQIHS